ncbi:MAG: hypothetical protein KDJ31_01575 [Candidatus Competibacteraceae bacterium]|nr:hypothetical protein [Candidatus Competibacteraceae bacterium]HRY16487.1 hypothetical protein [Candidatus Competibacteraceae bacterium]
MLLKAPDPVVGHRLFNTRVNFTPAPSAVGRPITCRSTWRLDSLLARIGWVVMVKDLFNRAADNATLGIAGATDVFIHSHWG